MRTNIQENWSIFNEIRHIQEIVNILKSLPTKPLTQYYIGVAVKIPLCTECYDSMFVNDDKWKNPPHLVLRPNICHYHQKYILRPRISFRVNTKDIYNQYDFYSRKCADGSSMIDGVELSAS